MAEKDLVFYPYKEIESSPLKENAFSLCVNTINKRGLAGVNYSLRELEKAEDSGQAYTFTRSTIYAVLSSALSGWETGVAVEFSTTNTLPTGISAGTVYYLRKINSSTFRVHPTYDDAQNNTNGISLSSDGTGTHTATRITLKEVVRIQENYVIDTEGNFWDIKPNDSMLELLSKGSGDGVGMEVYRGYVYLFRGDQIDRWEIATQTLSAAWQSDAGGVSVVDKNDYLYIANGSTIRSYDGTTYNSTALSIINGVDIVALSELGQYLSIAGDNGKLYLWDKNFETFETPIDLPNVPKMLIPANNLNYAVLETGDIYVTNGTTTQLAKEFPKHLLNNPDNPFFILKPYAYRVDTNSLFIGFASTALTQPIGIYEYNMVTNDFKISHIASNLDIGDGSNEMAITAIQNKGDFYAGWSSDSLGGGEDYNCVDALSATKRYAQASVYSALYRVGLKRNKRTYRQFEILLGDVLKNGQSVSLYYRETLAAAWNLLGTFNELNKFSYIIDKAISVENLQLKLEINTNEDQNTPYVEEVRCYE